MEANLSYIITIIIQVKENNVRQERHFFLYHHNLTRLSIFESSVQRFRLCARQLVHQVGAYLWFQWH